MREGGGPAGVLIDPPTRPILRSIMRIPRLLVAGLLLLAAVPLSAAAQGRTLVIESFHSDITVRSDGVVEVRETIRPRFTGSWNGLVRNIERRHTTAYGERTRLDLSLVAITDDQGNPLRYEEDGGSTLSLRIYVPGAVDATRTVVIRYTLSNVLRFFPEDSEFGHIDEIYWQVTGANWEVPIEQASARIQLPLGVMASQAAAYTGTLDSRASDARIEQDGGVVQVTTTRALSPGEGLTVAVGWPAGMLPRPKPPSAIERAAGDALPAAVPLLIFVFAFQAWKRNGKDPEARAITVQYEPPKELTPAETGTLIDHRAEMRDITSTLVDLAVRGYVHIEKRTKKTLGIFSSTDYVFHLKRPHNDWNELRSHERGYLSALFSHAGRSDNGFSLFGGDDESALPPDIGPLYGSVKLSSLKNRFYKDLPQIKKAIYAELIERGHYKRSPENVRAVWSVGGLFLGVGSIFAAAWVGDTGALPVDPMALGAAGIASGLVLLVFGQIMPARTLRGARTREHALGFREFLSRVEEDRYRRMITSPELFETYLPFAMAFKVEERWAKAFEDMYAEPPRWYSGYDGHAFRASSFTRDMSAMSAAASSTMSSSPSGSGGGGSVGGGSGGGGGGGF